MISTLYSRLSLEFLSLFQKSDDPSSLRTQRLKISLITSLAGKGVSIVVQLIAVPIAISALGIERFGVYAMLTALLNWLNMATVGVLPGLTVQIVTANANMDRKKKRRFLHPFFYFQFFYQLYFLSCYKRLYTRLELITYLDQS